jgi:hypothetical protein
MSGRDLAKFTSRPRDCRSPEALARRRERSDYNWATPFRPPIVSITPHTPKPPQTEPAKPDFGVKTPDCGHWSADGRFFLWQPL